MPELPDVEVFRRYLAHSSLHRPVDRVEVPDEDVLDGVTPQSLGRALSGTELETTRRHGKYLFASADGRRLVLHFGMSGRLEHLTDEEEQAPEYSRVVLRFEGGDGLAYIAKRKLGRVGMADDVDAFVKDNDLGPDALDVDVDLFDELLSSRRGMLKPALMDQSLVAGIGNIYGDEILFQAKLRPKTGVSDLGAKERRSLHRHLKRVLETAIDRQADPSRMPRTWLLPNRQEDAPCPRGDGEIRRITVSGRSTFYCPSCQKG